MKEMINFLNLTNFDTTNNPPTICKNFDMASLMTTLEKFKAEVRQLYNDQKKNKKHNKIVIFVYYTGHGCMREVPDLFNNTWIIHKQLHEYTNITGWIYTLAKIPNTQVFGLLDCCRTQLPESRSYAPTSVKPEKG